MAVNLQAPERLLPVGGVVVGSACAGIKQRGRDDLAVLAFVPGTQVAGVYTQSHFAAPPVLLARARQADSLAWVINSGNANAATGQPGEDDARAICAHAAALLKLSDQAVQPFSTGVIGERLPVERIKQGLDVACGQLQADGWMAAAQAIMTTDTVVKGCSRELQIDGRTVTITGIAKGAGMIKPNMATMLAYIACDATVSSAAAQQVLQHAVERSFNRITVDGDTSTNDCVMLACTGVVDHPEISGPAQADFVNLCEAVTDVARELAQAVIRDGEGATKFITVRVTGGSTTEDCLAVAYTIAESPLVKTAMFAGDANWGRFCMAIGRAPVSDLDVNLVQLWLDDVQVAQEGLMSADYSEALGAAVLAQEEFTVTVDLGSGDAEEMIWTTDLSYEYVRINAEYRT